jgi:DNA mismatch repair protein MutS
MGIATANTPLMQQYQALKSQHPNELLFFHLGDFYELFDEDAKRAAPVLEVALTHRHDIPMCGVPVHAVDNYIAKLLKAGLRVAIADQMEDPTQAKGLVKREVVRVITPGTLQEDSLLQAKRSNFLASISVDAEGIGIAALECSTGEFIATQVVHQPASRWQDELKRLAPSEVVLAATAASDSIKEILRKQGIAIAELPAVNFSAVMAQERLKNLFESASLRGYGLEGKPMALAAAGALVHYLDSTQCGRPVTLKPLRTYSLDDYLLMDAHTLAHLELQKEGIPGSPVRTLLDVIDQTSSPMGGRLIRRWLVAPLKNSAAIDSRLRKVEFFVENKDTRRHLRAVLQGWPDTERILARLTARTVSPRDLSNLGQALRRLPKLNMHLELAQKHTLLQDPAVSAIPEEPALSELLDKALVEAPPHRVSDGGVIRDGYNAELDEIRGWIQEGKQRLLDFEKREREATGISSLKVSYNSVFGYFIEVTRAHLARVPGHYTRKQTMANAERYITPELKDYETKILGAQERAQRLETTLVESLCAEVLKRSGEIQQISQAVAELDVFLSLAETAERHRYCKPKIVDSDELSIREGRHPVLDEVLPSGTLVSNDLELDGQDRQILILTGPNMSGKSTYLRQTALIVILAQMGSYVPAAEATIGIVDHLFTRIGASDRLAEGESTFMVEMVETAHILNHATKRSLVILDEVGRGTSTYDGISIAWACVEYLHGQGPKVLFATHYFELTELAEKLTRVHNAHVTAREWGDQVVFLHKVEPGPADRAYGIHVAKLAGVPKPVLERAQTLLHVLESKSSSPSPVRSMGEGRGEGMLFNEAPSSPPSPILRTGEGERQADLLFQELKSLEINSLTPLDALLQCAKWKKRFLE